MYHFCPVCGSKRFYPNCFKSKRCLDCGFEWFLNASAATAAFVVNEHRELLVCRRAKDPAKGMLDLPGGFVDPEETLEECLTREMKEEVGGVVWSSRYLFSLPNRYLYSGLSIPTTDSFFLVELEKMGTLQPSDDVDEIYWISLDKVRPSAFGLQSISKAVARFLQEYNP